MLAAAAAWDSLAAELESAAAGYSAVVAGLIDQVWSGPASAAMATAVAPYVAWLQATAGQAGQTATQAKMAAVAYEAAFAMTVPPSVVAANRALLAALIATNLFGQNTPAIAATEAHYAEMWTQDATAMYDYASSSAAATTLTSFSEPPHTTDPAGLSAQAVIVDQAAGSATEAHILTQLISALPAALQQFVPFGAATSPTGIISSTSLFGSTTLFGSTSVFGVEGLLGPTFLGQTAVTYPYQAVNLGFFRSNSQVNFGTRLAEINANVAREADAEARFAERQAAMAAGLGSSAPVSAGMGRAGTVGRLAVPSSWAGDPVAIRPAALALPDTGVAAAAVSVPPAEMPGSVFSQALMSALSPDTTAAARPKSKPVLVRNPASERIGQLDIRS